MNDATGSVDSEQKIYRTFKPGRRAEMESAFARTENEDMHHADRPELSVILATPDNATGIRLVMQSLDRQTAKARVEVVIVVPSRGVVGLSEKEWAGYYDLRIIEIGPFRAWATAMAAGIREAKADVVLLGEDHAFWTPAVAANLIGAHRGPFAAVGPAMDNANPYTVTSRANMLLDYGLWLSPHAGGAMSDLPGHNSSYKRKLLLEFEPTVLEDLLGSFGRIHAALIARGYKLRIEKRAICFHVNPANWGISIWSRYAFGRMYGATRANGGSLSPLMRLLYVAASPLLPIMRLKYALSNLRRSNRLGELQSLPMALTLLMLTFTSVVGEVVGYGLGLGRTKDKLSPFELARYNQIPASDLAHGLIVGAATIKPGEAPPVKKLPVPQRAAGGTV